MELELDNHLAIISGHHSTDSNAKLQRTVLLNSIVIGFIISLVCPIDPVQAVSDDKKLFNRVYGNNNSQILSQSVVFDLPSKHDIKNNTNAFTGPIKELVASANLYLVLKPNSVMDKDQLPPSGDKHDFLSLAPFRWPDNTKSNNIPYVYRDGKINPEVFLVPDRANLGKMIERVKILSAAYYFTDDISYAYKASEILRVWFLNNDTHMNPNLEYAEMVTGKDNGTSSGIIAANYFPVVLDSITMIQDSSAWTDKDQRGIELWFENYLDWLLNSEFGKKESQQLNNHGTWYDVQASSIALYLDKREIAEMILENNIDGKISSKIQDDGSQSFETQRQTSLDYHIFNLQGLFYIAKIGEHTGIDLWNYETSEGAGLHKALDYLLPYVMGKETWPHKQIKPIKMEPLHILLCQATEHYEDNETYLQALRSLNEDEGSQINTLLYGCVIRLEH